MALIKCRECSGSVSTEAFSCPHCGAPRRAFSSEKCSNCGGSGYISCPGCEESGELVCTLCDGTGTDDEGYYCKQCEGSQKVPCRQCGGAAVLHCARCGGPPN